MMESKLPKISIVTPSFNQAEFIEETIQSVLSQGYPNLEYIVIDGGSTDGSVDIIKKYEKYLTYWESEQDRGHAHALNKGFARTTGDIMAWINSDDKYLPKAFKIIGEIYTEFPEVEWTMGLYSNFDRDGALMGGDNITRAVYKNVYSYIFNNLHIQQESVFWRRSLWERAGDHISEDVHFMIDTELWCRFFLLAELWHIDQVVGGYRTYGINRFHVNKNKVEEDIQKCICGMKENLPCDVKKLIEDILQYSIDFNKHRGSIKAIEKKINKGLLLKIVPFALYQKLHDYLFSKEYKRLQLASPLMPVHASLCFKKIIKAETGWQKEIVPYQFPY